MPWNLRTIRRYSTGVVLRINWAFCTGVGLSPGVWALIMLQFVLNCVTDMTYGRLGVLIHRLFSNPPGSWNGSSHWENLRLARSSSETSNCELPICTHPRAGLVGRTWSLRFIHRDAIMWAASHTQTSEASTQDQSDQSPIHTPPVSQTVRILLTPLSNKVHNGYREPGLF
ncbi:hypothetical protein BJ322DRAFT_645857 [Thelephora terrestris]|uniref:Uncharacterized protein n=1 Tax=Thelephora terrestris TaxID=56493 RepID=A0A9P6HMQ0_9AGAM|nr:hypothetical protein BJ322DRAFT_645857 [Thelephora terrestris]